MCRDNSLFLGVNRSLKERHTYLLLSVSNRISPRKLSKERRFDRMLEYIKDTPIIERRSSRDVSRGIYQWAQI
jgi:hypothetical protein